LIFGIIGYVLPFFGWSCSTWPATVAAFNLPARVGQRFAISL
jgi:hypothetical protein